MGRDLSVWPLLPTRNLVKAPFPSKFCPMPGQPDQAVPELLVVFDAGRGAAVLQLGVADGVDHVRQALVEEFGLLVERHLFGRQFRQRRAWPLRGPWPRRRARSAPARPAPVRSMAGSPSRSPASISRRGGCRARMSRVGGKEASSAARPRVMLCSALGQLGDRGAQARRTGAAKAAKKVLKLTISSPSCCSCTFSAAVTLPMLAIELGEVVRFGARQRLVDDRPAAQRFGGAVVGLVERFGGVHAMHLGKLFGVFGGARLARQGFAVVDQEVLQVRPRVGVQRVQNLVELDRIGGLRDRDRRPGGERPGRRAARLQFDEPVAFEEDPRPDLQRWRREWIGRPRDSISMRHQAGADPRA